MANRDIIVIGGSAGALQPLKNLIAGLPANLPASIFVVLHISPWQDSELDKVLNAEGTLKAIRAGDNQKFQRGRIYIPTPDEHLLIENGRTLVVHGPKENRHRPAIDPLFRSAALHYGPRTIGVLLSGMLDDGTSGLWQIKRSGGIAVVQNPADALQPQMPQNALDNVDVDHSVSIGEMGPLLVRLANGAAAKTRKIEKQALDHMNVEEKIVKMEDGITDIDKIATPSQYTCPECSGTLYEFHEGKLVRYRCRTGHAFAEMALMAGQRISTEENLWAAMRALREKSELLQQLAQAKPKKDPVRAKLQRMAKTAETQATNLRDMIESLEAEDS